MTDPLGHTTATIYDAASRTLATSDGLGLRTSFSYDTSDRPITRTNPANETVTTAYDKAGRVIRVTDGNGQIATTVYDAASRAVQVINALGHATISDYDCADRRVALIDAEGQQTTFVYDAADQELRQENPLGRIVTTLYDAAGRNTRRIDARGNRTTLTYDGANRLTGKKYPDGSGVTISYDGAGHRQVLKDSTGSLTWTYDKVYRVKTAAVPTVGKLTFTYDTAGQRTKLTDSLGQRTTYTFDNAGRMTKLKNAHGETTTFVYDNGNRRVTTRLANGSLATFAYDKAGRVRVLANKKSGGTTVSRFTYTYDKAGNRKTAVEALGGLLTDRVTYVYDATYQLLGERRSGVSGFTHTFTYDNVGNRQTWNNGVEVTTYTYDAANELLTTETLLGRTTFTYDLDGNQRHLETPIGDLTTNTWDYENRNTRVELPTGPLVTYVYNADHQRVATIDVAGLATTHVWDGNNVLADLDDTGLLVTEYTLEPNEFGKLLSQRQSSVTSWHHYDAQGSTRELSNSAEVVTDDETFSGFGQSVAATGATPNPYAWKGELGYRKDQDTGRQYLLRRFYDALFGRMLSQDPEGFAGDTNLYRYVGNNPANVSDPGGTEPPDVEAARSRLELAMDEAAYAPSEKLKVPRSILLAVPAHRRQEFEKGIQANFQRLYKRTVPELRRIADRNHELAKTVGSEAAEERQAYLDYYRAWIRHAERLLEAREEDDENAPLAAKQRLWNAQKEVNLLLPEYKRLEKQRMKPGTGITAGRERREYRRITERMEVLETQLAPLFAITGGQLREADPIAQVSVRRITSVGGITRGANVWEVA